MLTPPSHQITQFLVQEGSYIRSETRPVTGFTLNIPSHLMPATPARYLGFIETAWLGGECKPSLSPFRFLLNRCPLC
jgi:hypothetical protein